MLNSNELLLMLQNGCKKLQLNLAEGIQIKIINYLLLLKKWNKTYNLTAIDDPKEIITHHILDSLAIIPYINGTNILDVGSGAGLPGIPLSLALPQKKFVLLDSNIKKTRFLFYVATTMNIGNVEIVHQRVENYQPKISQNFNGFDTIVTRAFSSLQETLEKTRHLPNKNCCLLAMKGKIPIEEIEKINKNEMNRQVTVYNINVPELNEERHLVVITLK